MKEIKLTKGMTALVDDADYDYLIQWNWWARKHRNTWYAYRSEKIHGRKHMVFMHKAILRPPSGFIIDHKDHDGLNNQRNNIRICTNSQNKMNVTPMSATGLLGVYFEKNSFYRARIRVNGQLLHLGVFNNAVDAAKSYNKAAVEHFGEFANLNPV